MDLQNQTNNTINIPQVNQTQANQTSSLSAIDISKMKIEQTNTLNIIPSDFIPAEQSQKLDILKREPLKLKFKGIILNKVLSEIYLKSYEQHFPLFIKTLTDISNKNAKSSAPLWSLQAFQKRVLIVILTTIQHIIDQIKSKKIFEAFRRLKKIKKQKLPKD